MQCLPRTFLEAIQVVRLLKIRYLWIDSLCIIQDSREDWEAESAIMGDLYHNAVLTIAAARGTDPTKGLFVTRNSWTTTPCRMDMLNLQHPQNASGPRPLYALPATVRIAHGPLMRRAWAYQEQILSRRCLLFSDDAIYWQCASSSRWERDLDFHGRAIRSTTNPDTQFLRTLEHRQPQQPNLHYCTDDSKLFLKSMREVDELPDTKSDISYNGDIRMSHTEALTQSDDPVVTWESMHLVWYGMVSNYANRDITVPSDRLPGISGLTSMFQSFVPTDRYIAGLWLADIHLGLLWNSFGEHLWTRRKVHPPQVYIAPSWSWASCTSQGAVYFIMLWTFRDWNMERQLFICENWTSCLKVQDAVCILRGKNPYGEIGFGTLKLEGLIADVDIPPDSHEWGGITVFAEQYRRNQDKNLRVIYLDPDGDYVHRTQCLVLAILTIGEAKRASKELHCPGTWCLVIEPTRLSTSEHPEFWRTGLAIVDPAYMEQHGKMTSLALV